MRGMTCLAATWRDRCSEEINEAVDNFVHKHHQVGYCPALLMGLPSEGADHVCFM